MFYALDFDSSTSHHDLLIWKGGVLRTLYRQQTLDSDLARHTLMFSAILCGGLLRILPPGTCLLEAAPLRR